MSKFDAMWEMNTAHHKELLQVAENQRSLARVLGDHSVPSRTYQTPLVMQ